MSITHYPQYTVLIALLVECPPVTQVTRVRSPVEATLMFSLSLAVLFNQLYMYSMYPSAVVPPPPPETDRLILCTLYGAVDFLKVLKIAVVGGGGGCYSYIVHLLCPC